MTRLLTKVFLFTLGLCLTALGMQGQMTVTTGNTATELAAMLAGEGVEVSGATLNPGCATTQRGTFGFPVGTSDLGIDSGIVLTTGKVDAAGTGVYSPVGTFISATSTGGSDPDLATLLPGTTLNDACVLEFDFKPSGDTIKFRYVFGSEEYPEFACSGFNDVFGFFISGGAFGTPTNIALVPGTTIPVAINSINKAPAGTSYSVATCAAMGTGSPFSMYYVDNEGVLLSPNVAYDGFTTVLTAIAAVNPCDTYHLKLAIADGLDQSYDSGVFLESGSLISTNLEVRTYGGAGFEIPYTNCVRGCPPGKFTVKRTGSFGEAITVPYSLEGTAVNGVDYALLPGSVVIPAGEETADVYIVPTILPAPVGPKTVVVKIYSPYVCGDDSIVLSSDTITIFDRVFIEIEQADTTICVGESVNLHVNTDTVLDLVWTPTATLVNNPDEYDVIATPTTTTSYVATVSLAVEGVACPASSDTVKITVLYPPDVSFADSSLLMCLDGVYELNPIIVPEPDTSYTYFWSPPSGLSSTVIRNPEASPATSTLYTVTVNSGAVGCDASASIYITVLPNDITLINNDTSVCAGSVVPLNASGHPAFTYYWTPETYIVDPHAMNTAITATESGWVTVTASHEGCDDMPHSFYLDVQPIPKVDLGADRTLCSGDTAHLYVGTTPTYSGYTYDWTPGMKLTDSTIKDPIFNGYSSETYIVVVQTPIGCEGRDTLNITVNPSQFATVNISDTALCPDVRIQLQANGAVSYRWEPSYGLDNDSIANPLATPDYTTEYVLFATSDKGCVDTVHVRINVLPGAVTYMPDSVQIWPGEKYQIDLTSNAHYFSWFPPEGLDYTNIANPYASPEVRTRYFVTATTEGGCSVVDSIDIIVNLESVVDIPNAFAPGNSFSNNGKLYIVRRGDATLNRFDIYNRWGNKVFSTTDINEGWDGTFQGTPQPLGVYVYDVEVVLKSGQIVHLTGNVTLIR